MERLGDAAIRRQIEGLAAIGSSGSIPEEIAGESNMLPANRGGMGKQIIRHRDRCCPEMLGSGLHVALVPIDDRGDDQVRSEARRVGKGGVMARRSLGWHNLEKNKQKK